MEQQKSHSEVQGKAYDFDIKTFVRKRAVSAIELIVLVVLVDTHGS